MARLLFFVVAAVAICLVMTANATAEVITIVGDKGDGDVAITGQTSSFTAPTNRVGVAGDDIHGAATVFFFALPDVPSPMAITAATLQIGYMGHSQFTVFTPPNFNADLFGLGGRSTPTILPSDYYDGNASGSTDTLLAQGFLTPLTVPGNLQVSSGTLLALIQGLYQPDGKSTAAFAVFRVNPDVHLPPFSGPYRGFELASADNTDNGGAFVPTLTLMVEQAVVVPEPSALIVFLAGSTVLAGYICRRLTR